MSQHFHIYLVFYSMEAYIKLYGAFIKFFESHIT